MGVVYRATDVALERSVALKLLAPELARDESFRRRFATESKVAASLDHANVIPIYHAGDCDGVLYLAMRFVRGEDLRLRLHRAGRLEPAAAARLVAQVGSALDAAHEAGLVHRDVKPANVLLDDHEHAYLTDFGLTKRVAADTVETRTGQILGTLDYIAPEQIRGEPLGPYTDVYALACMTVHLLTGEVPFTVPTEEGKLWAHLSEPPPRPSARRPELSRALDAVLARAMAKDPALRYATAGELASATSEAVAAPPRRRVDPAARVAAARARAAPMPSRAAAPPAPDPRRAFVAEAMREPFNLAILGVLLVLGVALGTPLLMLVLALAVYAAAVARSYLDPDTRRRALARRGAGGPS
jgi:serine/threonine-protein kinase